MPRHNPGHSRQINPNCRQQRARPLSKSDDGSNKIKLGGGGGWEEEDLRAVQRTAKTLLDASVFHVNKLVLGLIFDGGWQDFPLKWEDTILADEDSLTSRGKA